MTPEPLREMVFYGAASNPFERFGPALRARLSELYRTEGVYVTPAGHLQLKTGGGVEMTNRQASPGFNVTAHSPNPVLLEELVDACITVAESLGAKPACEYRTVRLADGLREAS